MMSKSAGRAIAALCGLLAAAAALGSAELMAGVLGREAASPVFAVGSAAIDRTPIWLKEFAIRHFGTHDKQILLLGLGVTIAMIALLLGLATRRLPLAGIPE